MRGHTHQWIATPDLFVRAPADGTALRLDLDWARYDDAVLHVGDVVYESCPLLSWSLRRPPPPSHVSHNNTTRARNDTASGVAAGGGDEGSGSGGETWRWMCRVLAVIAWWCGCQPRCAGTALQPAAMWVAGLLAEQVPSDVLPLALVSMTVWLVVDYIAPLLLALRRQAVRYPTKPQLAQMRELLAWNVCYVLAALAVSHLLPAPAPMAITATRA